MLRYDFNEPCKGKDQFDRESAGAKAVINSYVSSGNDVMRADDFSMLSIMETASEMQKLVSSKLTWRNRYW